MEPDTQRLALVTGGGRGIGAAICRRLAAAGHGVLVAARSQDDCGDLADELRAGGARAWPLHVDVTDRESVRDALEVAREEAGAVDWLVNNAGISEAAPFARGRDARGRDVYERHLAVNFHGARHFVEDLVDGMLERGYGRIVNVASSAGLRGYARVAAYCASKHALVGYTRAAALELEGSGVSMAAVCPHFVDAGLVEAASEQIAAKTGRGADDVRASFAAQNPGGRLVTADEVAEAVLELLVRGRNGALVELDGS